MKPRVSAIVASIVFPSHFAFAQRKCYNPDGTDRNNGLSSAFYQPCTNDEVSMCCSINGGGDECLSDLGLCYHPDTNIYWRESCTDQSWNSSSCIKLFINGTGYGGTVTQTDASGNNITDVSITPCDDGSWCYGTNNIACCSQFQGYVVNYNTGESQLENPNGGGSMPATITFTITPSFSPSKTATTVTVTATESSSSSKNGKSSSSLSTGAIAGLVVGVTLGVGLLLFLIGCLLGRRKQKNTVGGGGGGAAPPGYVEEKPRRGFKSWLYGGEMESTSLRNRHELPAPAGDADRRGSE